MCTQCVVIKLNTNSNTDIAPKEQTEILLFVVQIITEFKKKIPVSPKIQPLYRELTKKIGDCVIAMRKSLTARFIMKKLGGVLSFLLLKHILELKN